LALTVPNRLILISNLGVSKALALAFSRISSNCGLFEALRASYHCFYYYSFCIRSCSLMKPKPCSKGDYR
jgi:hypothetical protein